MSARDYDDLIRYRWYAKHRNHTTYAVRYEYLGKHIGVRQLGMHRHILGLKFRQKKEVDHVNGDGLDNRKVNLRIVTRAQNTRNRGVSKNRVLQFKGVEKNHMCATYRAQIRLKNKKVHLGCFRTAEEAAHAYNRAAKKAWGKFARLNKL